VGQVTFLKVYPMTFDEFLMALDAQRFIALIQECFTKNSPVPVAVHERLIRYYREYLCVGGMPESILRYVDNDASLVGMDRSVFDDIVLAYKSDMNKYVVSKAEALRISATYDSLPAQLGNPAGKFMYNRIEKSARRRSYEMAIDWLLAAQMAMPCYLVSKPETPLRSYRDSENFKLYLSDVGIAVSELHITPASILGDKLGERKGLLAESYVAQELVSAGIPLLHWASQGSAEVDFLMETKDGVVPIEAKAGDNVRSKSLKVYSEKFRPSYALRVSSRNFGFEHHVRSVPLYAAFCLRGV
jgi:predicted AAA+ superfamily ATPase